MAAQHAWTLVSYLSCLCIDSVHLKFCDALQLLSWRLDVQSDHCEQQRSEIRARRRESDQGNGGEGRCSPGRYVESDQDFSSQRRAAIGR